MDAPVPVAVVVRRLQHRSLGAATTILRAHVFEHISSSISRCDTIFSDSQREFIQNPFVLSDRGLLSLHLPGTFTPLAFSHSTEFCVFSCHFSLSLNSYVRCRSRITLQRAECGTDAIPNTSSLSIFSRFHTAPIVMPISRQLLHIQRLFGTVVGMRPLPALMRFRHG